MKYSKIIVITLITVLIISFFGLGLNQYLNLEFFQSQQTAIQQYYHHNPGSTMLMYAAVYIAVTGLSLPGAAIMTLIGGALFGLVWGTVLVSFASTIGASLAFLVARFLLHDVVQQRFGRKLEPLNRGVEREGGFYLFTLRLVPAFPFFMINIAMALTPIKLWTFFWISQIGMLPATLVYVNAGTQLAQIDSLSGILSPTLLLSFALLGLFPLIAKKSVEMIKARQILRDWPRPEQFERNVVVIGAGSGGLVSAYIAAAVRASVTLIEKHKMGGDCLNTGCVPSKALLRSAKLLHQARHAEKYGLRSIKVDFEFADIMARVQGVIQKIEPHDSVERYTRLGVECIQGEAKITSPYTVEVAGRTLTTRNIIIATGARPLVPALPGLEEVGYLTSDTLWELRELPARLLVLGGGPIGSELAQAFARFGSQVIQVEMQDRILAREDPEISAMMTQCFRAEGIEVLTRHKAKAFCIEAGEKILIAEHEGQDLRIGFDQVFIALGRVANTQGFGLEELGIPVQNTVQTNDYLQARYPNIYAVGDVVGPYQFTHVAAHQAWFATVNALFGRFRRFRVDYSVIPWATFTDPEVARVGLNEQEARAQGIPYAVTTYGIDDLDRAIADSADYGLVKVLTEPGKDKILGATIVGEHAGDLIAEYILAMRHGLGMNKLLGTIHIYPTLAEANKYAAGEWKKAHAPERVLGWLQRYHAWERGG